MSASTSIAFDIIARDRASSELNDVGDAADRAGRESRTMGDKMKTAAKVGVLALAAGAVVVGKVLYDATKAAAEDAAGQARLKKSLENTTGATGKQVAGVEAWISAQGKALGVADDDLRPALSKLASATHDVGKAQKLASLAMDVSAGSGKSLDSVSTALMKAQNGNVAALGKIGINTKDATGKTIGMKEAVKRMADTFGGAAKTNAGTLEGKIGRLKLMFDETKEAIGAKLLPIATKFADWIMDKAVPAISGFIAGMKDGTGAGGKLAGILDNVWGAVKNVFGFIMDNKAVLGTFVGVILTIAAATKAWAIVQGILNTAWLLSPIGLIVVGIAAVAAGVVYAYKHFETFRTVVDAVFGFLKSAVTTVLGFVKDHWATILVLFGGPIGLAVVLITKNIDKVKGVFNTFMDVGKKVFSAIGSAGRWLWNNALQPVFKFIVKGLANVMDFWAKMLDALGHIPGFGWAKDAADKLHGAADKARELADQIKKIPTSKHITVTITAHTNANVAEQAIMNGNGGGGGGAGPSTSKRSTVGGPSGRSAGAGMAPDGGNHLHIHIDGPVIGTDKRALARQLADLINAESRLSGKAIIAT